MHLEMHYDITVIFLWCFNVWHFNNHMTLLEDAINVMYHWWITQGKRFAYKHVSAVDSKPMEVAILKSCLSYDKFLNAIFTSVTLEIFSYLTHWIWVMHICVGNLIIIGSDNGLSPSRRQTIIWTKAGMLLIGPWETNFSEIIIQIQT